jgi:hypothetical protein
MCVMAPSVSTILQYEGTRMPSAWYRRLLATGSAENSYSSEQLINEIVTVVASELIGQVS